MARVNPPGLRRAGRSAPTAETGASASRPVGQVVAERTEAVEKRAAVEGDVVVRRRLVALDRSAEFGAGERFERNGVRGRVGPFDDPVHQFAAAGETLARVEVALCRRDGLGDASPGGPGRLATDGGERDADRCLDAGEVVRTGEQGVLAVGARDDAVAAVPPWRWLLARLFGARATTNTPVERRCRSSTRPGKRC